MKEHAELCENKLKHLDVVIISPTDLGFGFARMFEVISRLEMVKVVRDLEEALEILKIDGIPEALN